MSQSLNLLVFLVKSSMFSYVWIGMHARTTSLGMVPGFTNGRLPGRPKCANPHPRDWRGGQMIRCCWRGGPGIDWCIKPDIGGPPINFVNFFFHMGRFDILDFTHLLDYYLFSNLYWKCNTIQRYMPIQCSSVVEQFTHTNSTNDLFNKDFKVKLSRHRFKYDYLNTASRKSNFYFL